MRFYTKPHSLYCGIELHVRTMYVCILNRDGEVLLHRDMKAAPEPFLKAMAPYREDLVVCVACLFTWYWLADLCAEEGIPCSAPLKHTGSCGQSGWALNFKNKDFLKMG